MGVLRPVLASNRNVFALERVDVLLKFKEEGTFTRASSAMVWKNKVLTTVGVNEPRFETDPLTGRALGLRVEGARTNVFPYSDDFSSWVPAGITVTPNATTSPDGTVNADRIEKTTSAAARVEHYLDVVTGTDYAFSAYVKAGTSSLTAIRTDFGAGEVRFDTSTKVFTVVTAPKDYGYEDAGDGWYRIYMIVTSNVTATAQPCRLYVAPGTATSEDLYLWRAQFEIGSYPTTPIYTYGATATRASEIPNLALGDWFNPYEGTILSVATSFNTTTDWLRAFSFNDTTGADYIRLTVNGTINGLNVRKNYINQVDANRTWSGYFKSAITYKYNDFASSQDGSVSFTDNVCEVPRMTMLNLGHENNVNQLDGIIAGLFIYPNRKPNAEIESL